MHDKSSFLELLGKCTDTSIQIYKISSRESDSDYQTIALWNRMIIKNYCFTFNHCFEILEQSNGGSKQRWSIQGLLMVKIDKNTWQGSGGNGENNNCYRDIGGGSDRP
jgi:hypothetical protein